ncbi:hypothetical protein Clacol_005467 [Clathrus columnatus]|uniref:Condensin complex subunit 2 n=1 Tax=Clathrus columnatus TaxID=1419009 RepID=A0AAV5AA90_9AGAM|nr:hypothetical protein Clacol_005467 [Clathrus columnatus]
MSSSRLARARTKVVYASSSSSEEEHSDAGDTPKPNKKQKQSANLTKSTKKKRISDAVVPLNNSFSGNVNTPVNDSRTPLRTVSLNDINDDIAEKRRRRKSTKIIAQPSFEDVDSAMRSVAPGNEDDATTIPASSQQTRGSTNTVRARPSMTNVIPLTTVEEAPFMKVPLDVMSSNFEEWMKLATDNKINATNSWNFALIDYFHDMSLLRNVTDNSINFQKASCTLDGCVKIWTSRVDSVGTETFKLVSNLASEGNTDNLEHEGDPSDPTQDTSRKRNNNGASKHRIESTLAKSAAQLRTKKLDLEFIVDPLFKKTCADFDESGAQGLLMNHLNLGLGAGCLRVVFDAGDCVAASGEGASEDDANEYEAEEPEDLIDLSHLRREFLPSLDVLDTKVISHSLEGFSFERGAFDFTDITVLDNADLGIDSDGDDNHAGSDGNMMVDDPGDPGDGLMLPEGFEPMANEPHPVEDFFGDQVIEGDNNYGENASPTAYRNPTAAPGVGPYEPFDPRRIPNERDLVMAMTIGESGEDGDGGGMMDYFDRNFLKNWAGPEHWKVKRAVRRPLDATDDPEGGQTAAPKARREKKDKDANKIDFSKPLEISITQLFAPLNTRAGGKKRGKEKKEKKEKRHDQTLPDDMHFSSRQLVTLFLKPKFSLKMRGHRARINEGDGEVDERFWAQAAADQAQAQLNAEDETVDGGAIPFNTQFFHDDYEDGGGFEDVFDGDGAGINASVDPEEQDLLAATQGQSRRIRPEFVNYAKRAKRVDVRKLKENIWNRLSEVIEILPEKDDDTPKIRQRDEEGDVNMDAPSRAEKSHSGGRVFDTVLTRLKENYPPEKMTEISTSFCFICLLHLANEEGLRVQVDGKDEDTDEGLEERGVGNLWNLQVFKDPHAIPAA